MIKSVLVETFFFFRITEQNLKEFFIYLTMSSWLRLFVSVILWFILYLALKLIFKNKSSEWCNRIVTLVHSLVVCRLVEYSIWTDNPLYHVGGPNTQHEENSLVFSCSYFIFDTAWCLYMGSEGPLMIVHHLIGVFMLPLSLISNSSAAEIVLALWGGELTNPFLQYRYYLKFYNKENGRIAFLNNLAFAVAFVFIRVGFFTVLCFYFVTSPNTSIIIKLFGVAFYLVGLAWSYKIIGFVKRKLF